MVGAKYSRGDNNQGSNQQSSRNNCPKWLGLNVNMIIEEILTRVNMSRNNCPKWLGLNPLVNPNLVRVEFGSRNNCPKWLGLNLRVKRVLAAKQAGLEITAPSGWG